MMDAQFTNPLAYRLDVAGMSVGQSIEPTEDRTSGTVILEPGPLFAERLGLLQLDHIQL